jgi:hypothetical protein
MSQPLLEPLPEWVPKLVAGSFRFTPPIAGVANNEWTLHRITSREVIVVNASTSDELAISRRHLGSVTNGVVMLTKRLEFTEGRIRPANRDVVELLPASRVPRVRPQRPAEVVAIRELEPTESRSRRLFRTLIALGCLACLIAVYVFRDARTPIRFRRFSARPVLPVAHQPVLAPLVLPGKK